MKNLISLTWILFNSHFSISKSKYFYFKKKERRWEPILFIGIIITLVFALGPYYIKLLNTIYNQYSMLDMSETFILFSFFVSSIIGLFFGLFLVINTFFFSDNLRTLIPLPLKASEIITSKFLIILFDQLLISLLILLPSLIIFGINENVSFMYWIYSFFIFILAQVFPVGFISIILFPLSKIFKFKKHKDAMIFIVGIIVLLLSLVYVQISMTIPEKVLENPEDIINIYVVQNQIINSISRAYPPAILATKALINHGIISFLWFASFIGLNFILFLLLIFLGDKFYYSVYSEIQEHYASRKKLSLNTLNEKISENRSKISALVKREWIYFLRIPSFAFNGLASVFIFPILIIIFYFSMNSPDLGQIKTFIENYKFLYLPVSIIITVLASSMNSVSSSILSREGKLSKELKIIPVSYKDVFLAKLIQVSELTFMGIIFSSIVLAVVLKLNFIEIVLVIIISFLNASFLNTLQMLVDVSRPKLTWDNPQKAMKQNLNVAISIPIVFGYSFILGFIGFILMNLLNQILISLIFACMGIIGLVLTLGILKKAFKKFIQKDINFTS